MRRHEKGIITALGKADWLIDVSGGYPLEDRVLNPVHGGDCTSEAMCLLRHWGGGRVERQPLARRSIL